MKMYSVFDTKADFWAPPFFARTHEEALRAFSVAANDRQHQWGRHPADFSLFYVGEFDEFTGLCTGVDRFHLSNALDLVERQPSPGLFADVSTGADNTQAFAPGVAPGANGGVKYNPHSRTDGVSDAEDVPEVS